MLTLFLDTASREQSVAIIDGDLCVQEMLPRMGDSSIMPTIETLLNKHTKTLDDLCRIACIVGPGGFTSLRVGVATTNALRDALDIESAGVHLSDVWAARVNKTSRIRAFPEPSSLNHLSPPLEMTQNERCRRTRDDTVKTSGSFLWLHSTKRTHMFVRGFGADGSITPIELFALEDAAQLMGPYTGELLPEHEEFLTADRNGVSCTRIPDENITPIEKVLPDLLETLSYQKGLLHPWYGREGL